MLAQRPPMGWNTWNTFGEKISETLIMEIADTIVKEGYKDCGYEYVVIDDCWALRERNEDGLLVADPEKFPNGMKYLSDYIHSKGLKFGIYSCAGIRTCADYPSSYGYEFVDAKTFANWGVDFLKYDFCYFPSTGNCKNAYHTMSNALKASGREILFSACNWGVEQPWEWMKSVGVHMYRSTGDIFDNFESFKDIALSQVANLSMSSSYCFNDIDMLITGMYGKGNVAVGNACNDNEYRTHFALWCLFASPLMIGGDIRSFNEFTKSLLLNKNLIKINQDIEARPPFDMSLKNEGERRMYIKHLSNNEYVIALFNFTDDDATMRPQFTDVGFPTYSNLGLEITDVFTNENLGVNKDSISVKVCAHGCEMYFAKAVELN